MLDGSGIVGGVLVAEYMVDVKSEVRRYGLDGKLIGKVALPGIGSAGGFGGDPDDPETFFAFTSFATPSTIYRYDVKTGQASVWAAPKVAFDPAGYEVRAGLLSVEGRHEDPDVHRPQEGAEGARADAAVRLWRVQRVADPELLGDAASRGWSRAG